jgi:hypothetical protein
MPWIVTIKPSEPGSTGPHLICDDPNVVDAVLAAIRSIYAGKPASDEARRVLQLHRDGEVAP